MHSPRRPYLTLLFLLITSIVFGQSEDGDPDNSKRRPSAQGLKIVRSLLKAPDRMTYDLYHLAQKHSKGSRRSAEFLVELLGAVDQEREASRILPAEMVKMVVAIRDVARDTLHDTDSQKVRAQIAEMLDRDTETRRWVVANMKTPSRLIGKTLGPKITEYPRSDTDFSDPKVGKTFLALEVLTNLLEVEDDPRIMGEYLKKSLEGAKPWFDPAQFLKVILMTAERNRNKSLVTPPQLGRIFNTIREISPAYLSSEENRDLSKQIAGLLANDAETRIWIETDGRKTTHESHKKLASNARLPLPSNSDYSDPKTGKAALTHEMVRGLGDVTWDASAKESYLERSVEQAKSWIAPVEFFKAVLAAAARDRLNKKVSPAQLSGIFDIIRKVSADYLEPVQSQKLHNQIVDILERDRTTKQFLEDHRIDPRYVDRSEGSIKPILRPKKAIGPEKEPSSTRGSLSESMPVHDYDARKREMPAFTEYALIALAECPTDHAGELARIAESQIDEARLNLRVSAEEIIEALFADALKRRSRGTANDSDLAKIAIGIAQGSEFRIGIKDRKKLLADIAADLVPYPKVLEIFRDRYFEHTQEQDPDRDLLRNIRRGLSHNVDDCLDPFSLVSKRRRAP